MRKIRIIVPRKDDQKWKVIVDVGSGKRLNPAWRAYRYLEKKFDSLATLGIKDKISLLVDYGHRTHNEVVPSRKPCYILYATLCFLEDYLEPQFFNQKVKKYLKGSDIYE